MQTPEYKAREARIRAKKEKERVNKLFLESVTEGNASQAERLLKAGAELDAKNEDGNTPLVIAAERGHLEVAKVLIEHKADINAKAHMFGFNPLIMAASQGHGEMAGFLIDNGADVNATDPHGSTALMWAVIGKHHNVVKLLIAKGAEVNAGDNHGKTPLVRAGEDENWIAFTILMKHGGAETPKERDPAPEPPKAETAPAPVPPKANKELLDAFLAVAVIARNIQEARELLEKGADVNARRYPGRTAIIWAATNGDLEMAKMLIGCGADVNARDEKGKSVLHHARSSKNKELVSLLKKNEAKGSIKDWL
jgi:ankyrin repeat protein